MTEQQSDFTGELEEEVLQEDPPFKAGVCVPVVVEGPVAVQHIPSRSSGSSTTTATTTEPVRIAGADPRRRVARLISSQDYWVGSDQASVSHKACFLMLAFSAVLEITHQDEIWIMGDSSDAPVALMTENWAD